MRINNPEAIYLLLLLIPLLLSALYRYHSGSRQLLLLGGRWRKKKILDLYLVKFFFTTAMLILFVVCVTLSLMGIVWGQEPVNEEKRGIDAAFVIDISRSMLAEDLYPSRLDKAISLIRTTIKELKGSRFSIIVFKGTSVLAVPLTEDIISIENILNNISPSMLSSTGTDAESGLIKAINSFPSGIGHNGAIVLITDGGDLSGNLMKAAEMASFRNIPVFTIGAGTHDGVPIVMSDGKPIKDSSGKTVISSLDSNTLKKVASRTGGNYFDLSVPNTTVNLIKSIRDINDFSDRKGIRFRTIEHYRFFIIFALFFIFCNFIIRGVKWRNDF